MRKFFSDNIQNDIIFTKPISKSRLKNIALLTQTTNCTYIKHPLKSDQNEILTKTQKNPVQELHNHQFISTNISTKPFTHASLKE